MRRGLKSASALSALVLVGVVAFRTLSGSLPRLNPVLPASVPIDADGAVERFAGTIRIQTITEALQPPDLIPMHAFRDYLAQNFPHVHAAMLREVIGGGSLLFTWRGSDASLAPVLMLAHMDVVPVDPGSLGQWTHAPFAGERAEGFIWGRGAQDDKQAVCSLLEVSEALLAQGFQPRRTILFAFGDDEENDGHGAESIAALLASRGVHPQFVMDEGGQISRGIIPGVRGDPALVGIAEKGIVSLQLTVQGAGGHSWRPPSHTSIGVLSRALTRLEDHPMPARMGGVTAQMLEGLAPQMSLAQRVMVRNRWLFGPVLLRSLGRTVTGNALIRTTTAVTMVGGGLKDNVLPGQAAAVVNFRILPGDSVAFVEEHTRHVVDDARVTLSRYGDLAAEPSPVAPTNTPAYQALKSTIEHSFPQAVVTPNLLVARTDSARYSVLTPNVYRFFPVVRDEADSERVHGVNERLGTEDYLRSVQFMAALLRRESQ